MTPEDPFEERRHIIERMTPSSNYEALVLSLWLGMTAPGDKQEKKCLILAEYYSMFLNESQVVSATEEAERHCEWHDHPETDGGFIESYFPPHLYWNKDGKMKIYLEDGTRNGLN
jgi:hypothetical protein